jgi:uncharacterized membrane protein YdbT with pleckstrin-like domain
MQEPASQTQEETLWEGKPSQFVNYPDTLAAILIAALSIVGALHQDQPILWGGAVAAAVYFFYRVLVIANEKYRLTSGQFELQTGILTKQTDVVELYRIKDYRIVQPATFRLFGLANLILVTSDRSTIIVIIQGIKDPTLLRNLIRSRVEELRLTKRVLEVD